MREPVTVKRDHVTRWRLPVEADDYLPWRKGYDSRFWPIGSLPAFMEWPIPDAFDPADMNGYSEWSIWQQGRCAICGSVERGRTLHLDHDHRTGLIRGLLCPRCNQREGMGSSAVFSLWRAGMNPCRMFGWDYIWRGSYAPVPIAPEDVCLYTRAANLRDRESVEAERDAVNRLGSWLMQSGGGGNDST